MGAEFVKTVTAIAPIFQALAPLAGSLFGGGGGDAPQIPSFAPPPTPPQANDEEIQQKAKQERLRRSRASGLSSTILTSGTGVDEEALTTKPTLLGG